ncbi:MAG: hypothetical protein IKB93_09620, partial [Clostridia bacterium]|nr:hypothetical protein [Clostridia bacterium]
MENSFYPNLNSLFSANAPELRFHANEASNGYVIDDNGNIINTFPMLEYEERHVSSNKSRSYTYLSLCSYGQRSEVVCINSPNLFKSSTYIELFGNKPFAMFDKKSWSIFFTIIEVMLLEIEQRMIYEYSGWNQELDKYLFGNLMIEANNVRPVTSTLVKSKTVQSQKSCEDLYKDVDRIAKNIASKPIIGYIWFMYLMHSHCKPRFVQLFRLCPEFLTSIVGGTGSYKTSIAKGLFNTHDASLSSFEDSFASIR